MKLLKIKEREKNLINSEKKRGITFEESIVLQQLNRINGNQMTTTRYLQCVQRINCLPTWNSEYAENKFFTSGNKDTARAALEEIPEGVLQVEGE